MNYSDFAESLQTFARHANGPYVAFLKRLGLDREFQRAEGALVFDCHGHPFIDCIAGYGNLNLGHNPPEVISAATEELRSLRPFNWPFVSRAHARLAERLAQIAPGELECVLIVNSGAEAVDSALKLVRLATGKPGIIAAHGAWHGFTFGALSISEPAMCRGLGPLLENVVRVPFGDAAAVEQSIDDRTGALIVEPIQAESGAVVPPEGYLRDLVAICRRKEVVLIFDEIKTGLGKTGRRFACDHEMAVPDVVLLGKSLGGGAVPIGAVVAHRKLWGTFGYSFAMSSSSAAGNAAACAAALAVLDILEREALCDKAAARGRRLLEGLQSLVRRFPGHVAGASGRGLLTALHLNNPRTATEVVIRSARRGVLAMTAFCDKTRILVEPPLCITDDQLNTVVASIGKAVAELPV